MPKISNIRRIIPEDVDKDATPVEIVETIAGSYNDFADELLEVINGGLDFDNLSRRKITLDISFNSSGIPLGNAVVNTGLSFVSILYIGKIQNVTSPASRIKQVPYLDWTYQGGGFLKINYGVGFDAGTKYKLTLELVA